MGEHAQKLFIYRDVRSKKVGDDCSIKTELVSLIGAIYLSADSEILHLRTLLSILSMCKHKPMLNKNLDTFVSATLFSSCIKSVIAGSSSLSFLKTDLMLLVFKMFFSL